MTANIRLAVGLILLIVIAVSVLGVSGIAQRRAVLVASARAALQLAFVAAVLRGVFAAPATVAPSLRSIARSPVFACIVPFGLFCR